jgi:hypothetical protein
MDDEKVANEGGLVTLGQRGVTARPSQLARRGLDLLAATAEVAPRCCVDEVTNAALAQLAGAGPKGLDLFQRKVTDACLANVGQLTALESLDLGHTHVTDAGLVHLPGLTRLEDLDLSYTQVTDAGLVHLAGLRRLGVLCLARTQATDAGLPVLSELTVLKKLDLSWTEISDAGVVHLSGLVHLRELSLACHRITDARLPYLVPHLRRLTSLEKLALHPDTTSEAGRAMLKRALPGCRIFCRLI